MSCYLGSVRFNDGAEMMLDRDSIEECKIGVENYICNLPENERKFHWIFIETFPSGKIVARGDYTDGKVCWNMYDRPMKFQHNYDARDYMEVTEDGRFDE